MALLRGGYTVEFPPDAGFAVGVGAIALIVACMVAIFAVQLARTWRLPHRMRAIDDLSRSTNLVIPGPLRESLARAVAARRRGTVIGAAVGVLVVAVVGLLVLRPWGEDLEGGDLVAWVLLLAIAGGCTTFGAIAGGLLTRHAVAGSPHTARLTTLSYRDLVDPLERRMVALSVVGGICLPVLLAFALSAPWADAWASGTFSGGATIGAGLLAAVLWLCLARISRWLVAVRALTGDEHALAWSDALAARTVRDVAHLAANISATAALVAALGLFLALPPAWTDAVPAAGTIAWGIALVGIVASVAVTGARQPQRHVQRTLWPHLAAHAQ